MTTFRWITFLLLLCLASPVGAKEHYSDSLQDQNGNAIRDASITVYLAGTTTLATLYSTNAGAALANPLTTATDGSFGFYAANGRYDLVMEKVGYSFDPAHTAGITLFDLIDYAGAGNPTFNDVQAGTNTSAAMIVGTGASLSATGSGTITATGVVSNGVALSTGTTGNYVSSATVNQGLLLTGTEDASLGLKVCTNGQILKNTAGTSWDCAADSTGGTPTFDTVGTGTNSTAAMVVTTGASLAATGTGSITATAVVANAVALTTGTTGNYVASVTASQGLVMAGTEGGSLGLIACLNNEILKNTGGASWGCAADNSGSSPTFDVVGTGTNSTATMTVTAGASLVPASTGIIAATGIRPSILTVNAGNSPYTTLLTDAVILCDTTLAARTITLIAATNKVLYRIKNLGTNICTVNRAGSDLIDGTTNAAMETQYQSIDLVADGTSAWSIF